ncbi:DUF3253 domain-containing protein [Chiayiivirga flava]|uniref:DUF3253 domain-containing protein n=1 Tax=Chiayiivirga flava TaxID=659595 RepID=A0A7W8D3S8_9GAMM|nr:DUF3253 domain-containing protein [Chiayiivirga flava]MBB5207418.1 hypothetical protein [Chiayiivirga flava]
MRAVDDARIEHVIFDLLAARADGASICPSDVARALHDDERAWRALLPCVRDVAMQLARHRRLRFTRGAATLDPEAPGRGPIRLRLPARA